MSILKEIEEFSTNKLEPGLRDYLNRGAQNDVTLNANKEAFNRLRIRPRFLVDVSKRDLSIKLFGDTIPMPICVSPFGLSRRFHQNGEYETARGVSLSGTLMVVSSGSSVSIEEIAEAEPNLVKWFQLFIFKDRNITLDMGRRAKKAGYKAIVLTVDQTVMGIRYQNVKNKYEDKDERVNYRPYGVTKNVALDATWDDIKWLKQNLDLPLVLKGILTAEDALLALESGADAVFVSNHGARQVDSTPATLEALPEVVEAVGDRIDVYIDGGVRTGTDVFKALALGAKAVFIARPVCWGLVYNGAEGIKTVVEAFNKELDNIMTNTGCPTVAHITRSHVRPVKEYNF